MPDHQRSVSRERNGYGNLYADVPLAGDSFVDVIFRFGVDAQRRQLEAGQIEVWLSPLRAWRASGQPDFYPSDEDLSPGTLDFHPSDEDLSPGTLGWSPALLIW